MSNDRQPRWPPSSYRSLCKQTHTSTIIFFPKARTQEHESHDAISSGRDHREALALATRDYCSPRKAVNLSVIQNNPPVMETAALKASAPWLASLALLLTGPFCRRVRVCVFNHLQKARCPLRLSSRRHSELVTDSGSLLRSVWQGHLSLPTSSVLGDGSSRPGSLQPQLPFPGAACMCQNLWSPEY